MVYSRLWNGLGRCSVAVLTVFLFASESLGQEPSESATWTEQDFSTYFQKQLALIRTCDDSKPDSQLSSEQRIAITDLAMALTSRPPGEAAPRIRELFDAPSARCREVALHTVFNWAVKKARGTEDGSMAARLNEQFLADVVEDYRPITDEASASRRWWAKDILRYIDWSTASPELRHKASELSRERFDQGESGCAEILVQIGEPEQVAWVKAQMIETQRLLASPNLRSSRIIELNGDLATLCFAMARINDPEALDQIRTWLANANRRAWVDAVILVKQLRAPRYLDLLLPLLDRWEDRVIEDSGRCIQIYDGPASGAIGAFEQALRDQIERFPFGRVDGKNTRDYCASDAQALKAWWLEYREQILQGKAVPKFDWPLPQSPGTAGKSSDVPDGAKNGASEDRQLAQDPPTADRPRSVADPHPPGESPAWILPTTLGLTVLALLILLGRYRGNQRRVPPAGR